MTFFTDTPTGRRSQAEETLRDMRRIYEDETDPLAQHHLHDAILGWERVVSLLEVMERAGASREPGAPSAPMSAAPDWLKPILPDQPKET